MLKTNDLTLHYSGSQILYGISMEASVGQVTCVMGTNGVGKTSLLKAISGTKARSGGTLSLDGEDLPVMSPHGMAHRGVGYVPQGRMIFPLLTVQENLEIGLACRERGDRFVQDEIFELFPVLKEMKNRRGGDLSGGQQQQLAIGRALVTKPKLLLLDEPTEGIQPNIIQQIGRVIQYLRDQQDMAIVLVEQYFDFAYEMADHFYVLARGEVSFERAKSGLPKEELAEAFTV